MSLRSAAECLLLTTMLYAAGLAAFADQCAALAYWVAVTQPAVDTALFFVRPLARGSLDPTLIIYRHVLLVTVVLTGAWTLIGRRWLAKWGAEVVETYRRINQGSVPSRAWLDEAHKVSTLGAFGTVYLLLFDPALSASWPSFYRAAVFVVPVLSVLSFFLICRAMVFQRLAYPPPD